MSAQADLLEAARGGDEAAFERLVEPYRGELHAHCYRMLGSVHDAEDALQEAMLRVWRGLAKFEGGALRAWLYRIATNTSLDLIGRRRRRVLPQQYVPKADPHEPPGQPITEGIWLEPYPDETLEVPDGRASPDAGYEQREAVELAFVAALQHLSPRQRAVLILREVLGFSAKEVGETLDASVPSVNSALQRARKAVEELLPERSQQVTLRALGDARLREIVEEYMEAMRTGDVNRVVSMLAEEDATWSMPPLASWYGGLEELRVFLERGPLSGEWQWRHAPARANGQLAVGTYTWVEAAGAHLPFSLDVLTLEGERIKEVTAFVVRTADTPDGYSRWPDYATDPVGVRSVFERFGLPSRIP
ncbi:MAG TPA: sigma-70 family RNA polymerase sigma factor [Solirubrobacterales bacterium]|nr:sigma-70 family RNA polymerase sigma factor [Solirubrobacterales bacterium]